MHIVAYAVRTDAFREFLNVAMPLAVNSSTPRANVLAGLDGLDAYYEKYPKRRWGNPAPRNAETKDSDLRHHAWCSLDILLYSGISQIRAREPLATGLTNSVLHAYARALTDDPNWAPVDGESTQILSGRCTWLFPEQLRELITLRSALEVPTDDRLRTEYRRLGFRQRTDDELNAEIIVLAGKWIRIAELARFAVESGLTYVAYAEPYDTD